jgi:hypothetical protein
VVSKPQIRFKGKASRELKTERTRKYVSISICGTTQPLDLRWDFETTSSAFQLEYDGWADLSQRNEYFPC